jgi:hypothetical protein
MPQKQLVELDDGESRSGEGTASFSCTDQTRRFGRAGSGRLGGGPGHGGYLEPAGIVSMVSSGLPRHEQWLIMLVRLEWTDECCFRTMTGGVLD